MCFPEMQDCVADLVHGSYVGWPICDSIVATPCAWWENQGLPEAGKDRRLTERPSEAALMEDYGVARLVLQRVGAL